LLSGRKWNRRFRTSAAGKFAALFARRASRDLFDSHALLSRKDLDEKRLRSAFLVFGGMNRRDWRTIDFLEKHDRFRIPWL
jgi:hypothetical protein